MNTSESCWALITGASSGIGAAYATHLASKGFNLLITGRRAALLESQAGHLQQKYGIECEIIIGDLACEQTLYHIIRRVTALPSLNLLVCNAGFGNTQVFFQDTFESQQKMIRVHVDATTHLCHALSMKIKPPRKGMPGGIILVSSLGAFFSAPGFILYPSTKAYLVTLGKSLALTLYHQKIPVQVLCPGFTRTDFHNKLGVSPDTMGNKGMIRWMSPDRVVQFSLKKLRLGKVVIIPGSMNRFLRLTGKLISYRLYLRIVKGKEMIFR